MQKNKLWVILGLFVFMVGCETVKGARQGLKQDIRSVTNKQQGWVAKTDKWMQEHMW